MMTYLVTGGAGFIGANFVKYILNKYPDITVVVLDDLTYAGNLGTIKEDLNDSRLIFVKGNITDSKVVNDIFNKYQINYLVNFAAESHVDRSIENPQIFLETNILGTQNLLDVAKKHWSTGKDDKGYPTYKEGVKYLQVSTDEVYGSLGETGYFTEETPLDPRSPYSASKTGADLIVKAYGETYKMPINITRCSNNYGPYHFPEKLIPLIIKNILEGKQLPVYGDGSNVRDWLYVEDHCKAIDMVLRDGRVGEVYNIGGHNEKKNIDIVKLTISTIRLLLEENEDYRKALKYKDENNSLDWISENLITYVTDRLGHDQRYAIDPTKITNELGWYPETKFETGIVKTIRWYLENQSWVDEVTSGDYQKYYEEMYGDR
ncbi:dTDP-glucose 4,6-dehydratase [Dysgonomonadaceae bacterium PH5-43]|nr:dTDP-glucose 4,6-dehydratase [Dysgonomonadaceae bacterium PH5-43]